MMLSGMAARAGRTGLLALTAVAVATGLYTGVIQAAFAVDAHPAARPASAAAGWLTPTLLFRTRAKPKTKPTSTTRECP